MKRSNPGNTKNKKTDDPLRPYHSIIFTNSANNDLQEIPQDESSDTIEENELLNIDPDLSEYFSAVNTFGDENIVNPDNDDRPMWERKWYSDRYVDNQSTGSNFSNSTEISSTITTSNTTQFPIPASNSNSYDQPDHSVLIKSEPRDEELAQNIKIPLIQTTKELQKEEYVSNPSISNDLLSHPNRNLVSNSEVCTFTNPASPNIAKQGADHSPGLSNKPFFIYTPSTRGPQTQPFNYIITPSFTQTKPNIWEENTRSFLEEKDKNELINFFINLSNTCNSLVLQNNRLGGLYINETNKNAQLTKENSELKNENINLRRQLHRQQDFYQTQPHNKPTFVPGLFRPYHSNVRPNPETPKTQSLQSDQSQRPIQSHPIAPDHKIGHNTQQKK